MTESSMRTVAALLGCLPCLVPSAGLAQSGRDDLAGESSVKDPAPVQEAGTALPTAATQPAGESAEGPRPFGQNLFHGNFLHTRDSGLNPDYVVMPGDRVAVQTWGALEINAVFTIDGQGNLFLPEIGPIKLAGVRNEQLTDVVKQAIGKVYLRHFGVYTNLLSAKPIAVLVTGNVVRPGSYAGVPSDSVLFFLDQAGGIDPALGSYRRVKVLRAGATLAEVDLYDFLLRGALDSPQFQNGDTVFVERRGPRVTVQGNVARPSLVELPGDSATGADALAVVPKASTANEVTVSGMRDDKPYRQTLHADAFGTTALRDGDVIELRDDGRPDTILVRLEGEFEGPSVLSVRRGARLIDVLNHVPVSETLANVGAVHVRRQSVAKAQKDAIADSLFRLERSALLGLSSSNGEADIRVKEAELVRKFAERARLIDPLGRVVTTRGGQQTNILLEDGDTIVVPQRTRVVRISGEVQMAHAVLHERDMEVEDYVASAGGYSDRADDDHVILLHPDASVEVVDAGHRVQPGDEILVTPRVDSKTLQSVADITQIIYQVAVSAGVVLSIAW